MILKAIIVFLQARHESLQPDGPRAVMIHEMPVKTYMPVQNYIIIIIIRSAFIIIIHLKSHK